jgi:protein-S-isoprenylcysteine O-methyltransferase Ste14
VNHLDRRALAGIAIVLAVMAALLFLPAWTLDYWQACVFLGVFGSSSLAITIYLMKEDPSLLERRMHGGPAAEKKTSQKIIQTITAIAFIAMLVVPALDHRSHTSMVPPHIAVAGDILVAMGFLIVFFVYKENSFASATIELAPDQKVISTGPYALIRHPMYLGGLILFLGVPLALGSWRGLFLVALMIPAVIWRLLDEEKFLAKNLPGYTQYQDKVRYRLLPRIW